MILNESTGWILSIHAEIFYSLEIGRELRVRKNSEAKDLPTPLHRSYGVFRPAWNGEPIKTKSEFRKFSDLLGMNGNL